MSTTEQVKERAGEGAQQIQQKASEAKTQTREKLREQIDSRSTQTGEQVTGAASALRQTAERLRSEGQGSQANLIDQVAQRGEQLGRYLSQTDGDRLLHDVERFARRQPWLVAGAGALAGFLGARFMKASSTRRYEAGGYGRPALPPARDRGDV
jgi:hypothetical protein